MHKSSVRRPSIDRPSCRVRAGNGDAGLDIDALLFDCDGVLCDTEAEGHRVSFTR